MHRFGLTQTVFEFDSSLQSIWRRAARRWLGSAAAIVEIRSGQSASAPFAGKHLRLARACLLISDRFGARPKHTPIDLRSSGGS